MWDGIYGVLEKFENVEFEEIALKIIEKDKSYQRGYLCGEKEIFVMYKRNLKFEECYCLKFEYNKLVIFYPYESKFAFCPEEKIKIYKKVALSNWEKALMLIEELEI